MAFSNHKIELDPNEDRYSNIYHLGRERSPFTLKFRKGVTFFVFLSDEGREELQIGTAQPDSDCLPFKKRLDNEGNVDRYVIDLQAKTDRDGKTYYVAVVQDDHLEINFEDGYLFFVFSAVPGEEQLHITRAKEASIRQNDRSRTTLKSEPDVQWRPARRLSQQHA